MRATAALLLLGFILIGPMLAMDVAAQSPTPTPSDIRGGNNSSVSSLDYVQAVATVIGVVVATAGLGGVLYSLSQTRRDQRTQSGPYVRIDVCPLEGADDFDPPEPHFGNTLRVVDLAPDRPEAEKVTLCAWIRNYQAHPLGFALAVTAFFVLEAKGLRGDGSGPDEPEYSLVEVPYLEFNKPVRVDLFKIPRESVAFLWLASVSFYDFYDHRHEHQFGQRSTNALHGRLACDYVPGRVESIPEARPRGPKVAYE